jgi:hypothetical protein
LADYNFLDEEAIRDKVGVLYTIEIKTKNNFFIYDNYNSAFNTEAEVLFNEGLTF